MYRLIHQDDSRVFLSCEQGLACLRQRFDLHSPLTRRDLLALGLRMLKRSDKACTQAGEDNAGIEANGDTSAQISERCQRVLLQAARQHRRAHQLTRLLNAEVHWHDANQHHVIRLHDYAPCPLQPDNWAGLGVATYDVARTLLTEIHRLRAAGVPVEVRPLTAEQAPTDKGVSCAAMPNG